MTSSGHEKREVTRSRVCCEQVQSVVEVQVRTDVPTWCPLTRVRSLDSTSVLGELFRTGPGQGFFSCNAV